MLTSRITLPEREDINPSFYSKPHKEQQIIINLKHIYEHDLFDSYKKAPPYTMPTIQPKSMPQPPRPLPLKTPPIQKPTFLDPLNITLKGIIVLSSDDTKNRAIISDNKTDLETLYKVGDKIADAQLIRIFNNKIVLLRSNGQQEIMYMRNQEAQSDPRFAQIQNWHVAITMINQKEYKIFPEAFLKRIENLAHFIELLNLTTAYQKGIPIGTHVGTIEPQSLGSYLGLRTGDMIISINDIAVATTNDRLRAYQEITTKNNPFTITVNLMRNKNPFTLMYHIQPSQIELIKTQPVANEKKTTSATPSIQEKQESQEQHDNRMYDIDTEEIIDNNTILNDEIAFLEKLKEKEAFLMIQHHNNVDQQQDFV